MRRIEVYVVPRARRAGADGRHGGLPRLRLLSPPEGGRANAEAERLLAEILGSRVVLASGARSRRKLFDVDLDQPALDQRLEAAFGPNGGSA